jgi:hypothetical protein
MDKQYIKNRLRESLELLNEDEMLDEAKKKKKGGKSKNNSEDDKRTFISHPEVKDWFDRNPQINIAGFFEKLGSPFTDDNGKDIYDTKLIYKKIENKDYSFSKSELDAIKSVQVG